MDWEDEAGQEFVTASLQFERELTDLIKLTNIKQPRKIMTGVRH